MELDERDDFLLDFHLSRLNEPDRLRMERELERDDALRTRSERLGAILRPLDHWAVAPPPPNLADNILERVEERVRASRRAAAEPAGQCYSRPRFVPMRDLLAAAACIALLVSVMVPGISGVRSRSQRTVCAANMRSIYEGLSAYRQMFDGALPFAGSAADTAWLPMSSAGSGFASNSRHLYRLLRSGLGLSPGSFVCPTADAAQPMAAEAVSSYSDFPGGRNVSFDSLNLAGPAPNLRPSRAIAYLSDSNPLFVGGRFNETIDPDRTNSRSHQGSGQNVLTLDGHAQMVKTPLYGLGNDNLWTMDGIRYYTGTEAPTRPDDAFLVPGFPVTDPRPITTGLELPRDSRMQGQELGP